MYDILIAENIETYFEKETPFSSNGLWFRQLNEAEFQKIMKLAIDRDYSVTVFGTEDVDAEANNTN